jgi:hypothetical protein
MPERSHRRSKLISVVGSLIAAGLLIASGGLPWLTVTFPHGALPIDTLSVTGYQAAPSLAALSLAAIAVAVALTIARPVLRVALGIVQVLVAIGLLSVITLTILDPTAAAASAIAGVSGISDSGQDVLDATASLTVLPAVALVLAGVLLVIAISTLVTARRWPDGGDRHETPAATEQGTASSSWDRLSRGDDPTDEP